MNLNLENANVVYYDNFVPNHLSRIVFDHFSKIMEDEETKFVVNNGSKYKLNRKTYVCVDNKNLDNFIIPKIWGDKVTVVSFTKELDELKDLIERELNYKFNICLINYYSTGNKYIGYHSDNEERGELECIASISLGTPRKFTFREKANRENIKEILLEDKSLLVMDRRCQYNYEHSLPQDKSMKSSRLNITFRYFKWNQYEKH